MTAEVAVMNKSAVALAADSKVTVGSAGSEKTYDTINKIFTLSKIHPVGIMIFGNADFMEYPWETIIKLYRKQKSDRSENTIQDWAGDFYSYLTRFRKIPAKDKSTHIANVLHSLFDSVDDDALYEALYRQIPLNSKAFDALLVQIFNKRIQDAGKLGNAMDVRYSNSVIGKNWRLILSVVNSHVTLTPKRPVAQKALEFAVAALIKNYFSPIHSGIVIAGFGEREIFPSLAHCVTDGYIGGRIKMMHEPITSISLETSSAIEAFAQGEWPAPGSEDTELGVLMEPEVGHGETEVYTRVQA